MLGRHLAFSSLAAGIVILLGVGLHWMHNPKQNQKSIENPLFPFAFEDLSFVPLGSEKLVFPQDHGAHRQSGNEFWQLAGYLETQRGERFGLESTWFRVDLATDLKQRRSAWAADQIFHLSYTITPFSKGEIYRDRESARNAMGLAGYDPTQHKIQVYKREFEFHGSLAKSGMELNIPDSAYPLKLEIQALKPVFIPPLLAPFRYYIIPAMSARGTLTISGVQHSVTGKALFEHGWGRLPLGRGQRVQNRWMLQLSNGMNLYLLQSRRRDGTGNPINNGFMMLADGQTIEFEPGELNIERIEAWPSRVFGIRQPVQWRIRIPEKFMVLDLKSWKNEQEASDFSIDHTGMVSVSGQSGPTPIDGFGQVQ